MPTKQPKTTPMSKTKKKIRKVKNLYEINGVIMYASIIYDEVWAYSKKEALDFAKSKDYSDPSIAEFQEQTIDEPIKMNLPSNNKTK
jgi:hypothetical protein